MRSRDVMVLGCGSGVPIVLRGSCRLPVMLRCRSRMPIVRGSSCVRSGTRVPVLRRRSVVVMRRRRWMMLLLSRVASATNVASRIEIGVNMLELRSTNGIKAFSHRHSQSSNVEAKKVVLSVGQFVHDGPLLTHSKIATDSKWS